MNELLKQLTEAIGVSGAENEIRGLIRDLIADHVDEWWVDGMGNLLAMKKGRGESELRVLVDAHMDEIGLMVTEIDGQGTAKFLKLGGIDDRILLGKVVQVGSQKIPGVIGARPVHLLRAGEWKKMVKDSDMRIDIGASNKDQAAGKMKPGDRVAFVTPYQELGEVAIGKTFDNRAGCAALIELLRGQPYPFDLYASFTVQEEVGLRGAYVAANAIKPDVALILECTPAYDLPNKDDVSSNVALGLGPSVYVMDAGTIQHPRLVAHIMRTAEANDIPFQVRRPGGGGTNTAAFQKAGAGIIAATIATPGRYAHSPLSMINLNDYANVVRLADATLRTLSRSEGTPYNF